MTKDQWLLKIHENKEDLENIISRYHPATLTPHKTRSKMAPNITAPRAEDACEVCRDQIREKQKSEVPPWERFNKALSERDVQTLSSLLSDTWFGVPESTSCWSIPGFSVLVDLLDDPPFEEMEIEAVEK